MITLLADDEGRFVAEPSVVKKRVFGLDIDITAEHVMSMLNHMAATWTNLRLYRVNGQLYGTLLKFSEKQGIRYVVKSKLPEHDKSFEISDCGKFPEISANFPRVGLGRVEKKEESLLSSPLRGEDQHAKKSPDDDITAAIAEYRAIAVDFSKAALSEKRAARLAPKLAEVRKKIQAEHPKFTMFDAIASIREQADFFTGWAAWDLEWFIGTKKGRFNAEKTWLRMYASSSGAGHRAEETIRDRARRAW